MHGFNAPSGRRVYFNEDFGGYVQLDASGPYDSSPGADYTEIHISFADFEAIAAEYARWSLAEGRT
jgi:hypothetical protein